MTIIAAEAAPGAVADAEGAVAANGAGKAARSRAASERAKAASSQRARTRAARERDRAARGTGPYAPAPRPSTGGRATPRKSGEARGFAEGYAADSARKVRNHGKKSLTFKAGKGDYHKVVAAEFLFAVAVITVAPLVTPGAGSASTGPSPYGRQDITRLAGVFTLFFILALVSHGRPGKLAVTFGLLVDLGVLFRASQRGVLKGVASAFSKSGAAGGSASGGGQGANPGGPAVA